MGHVLPASFGLRLQRTQGSAELRLSVEVSEGSACAKIEPSSGCAPLDSPPSIAANRTWTLSTLADVWLDNGLVEIFVGNGTAVLSAFFARLYDKAAGLNGSVWSESNATAVFALEWSGVASAVFA
eukprot:7071587-Prymnesium_polylepis.1